MGESMNKLRLALINSNINPRDIRFSTYTKNSKKISYEENVKNLNIGFEIKI